jgi:hypothetical protein
MSLYREPRGRRIWPLAVTAILAAGVGLGIGLLVAPDEEDPSVSAAIEELRGEVAPAISALELVTIEYPQAVRGGEVVAETELAAARSQAEQAQATVVAAESDLAALDPAATERAVSDLDELVAEIDAEADPRSVEDLATRARASLEATVGG